jgi:hypothetical protein
MIDEHMIDEHMIDEHMIDEHMIDEHIIDEHIIDEHIIAASSSSKELGHRAMSDELDTHPSIHVCHC